MTRRPVLFDTSVTENARPFARWAALLARSGLPVRVREVSRSDYPD